MRQSPRFITLLIIALLTSTLFSACAKPVPYGEDNPAPIGVEQSYVLKSEFGSKEYKIKVKHVLRGQEATENFPPNPDPLPGTDYDPNNYTVIVCDVDLDLPFDQVAGSPISQDKAISSEYRAINGLMEDGFYENVIDWRGEYVIQFYPESGVELTNIRFGNNTSSSGPIWFSLVEEK